MDLDFGHGFIPRIGEDNYKAVDRCIGPADLFSTQSLDLPWAIVDGAWAEGSPHLIDALKAHGTRVVVDTFGWRYRFDRTFHIPKLAEASWAPTAAISLADHRRTGDLVKASLDAQAALGASAYLIPGPLPTSKDEDLRPTYASIFDAAASVAFPMPLIQFIGGHTQGTDHVRRLIDEVPLFVSAIYLQLTPVSPATDSPAKLEAATEAYRYARSRGFQVIAGHAGAITTALRALGVDGADAGLATGETFDQGRARREPAAREPSAVEDGQGGGRQTRVYLSQIDRSVGSTDFKRLAGVPAAAAELLGCRLPCHRFRPDDFLAQAREHSLWARVTEAQLVNSLPVGMRAGAVYERFRNQRSVLAIINGALEAAGQAPLDGKPIDNHIAWMSRVLAHGQVA